jgi:hypothetical protein
MPVATFMMDTCACGTDLSEGSVIVPESVPPATCAFAGTENKIAMIKKIVVAWPNQYNAEILRENTGSPPP